MEGPRSASNYRAKLNYGRMLGRIEDVDNRCDQLYSYIATKNWIHIPHGILSRASTVSNCELFTSSNNKF